MVGQEKITVLQLELKILEQDRQVRGGYLGVVGERVKKPMRTTDDEKIVTPANCVSCI